MSGAFVASFSPKQWKAMCKEAIGSSFEYTATAAQLRQVDLAATKFVVDDPAAPFSMRVCVASDGKLSCDTESCPIDKRNFGESVITRSHHMYDVASSMRDVLWAPSHGGRGSADM